MNLGAYLRERRTGLDPVALGLPRERRRTRGLRREEVAQRASISVTWYTWLEQGRGGAPSPDVLERIAGALMLTDIERERLFLLGLGRPPDARYQRTESVAPRLQRVLDRLPCPAFIRTATWDVVAWNRAAAVMMVDFGTLPPDQRNLLRIIFLDPRARAAQDDWEKSAAFVVSVFKLDTARAGATDDVAALVDELRSRSPEFDRFWSQDAVPLHGDTVKHIRHPHEGLLEIEYSTFACDGRSDLLMVVYNPIDSTSGTPARTL